MLFGKGNDDNNIGTRKGVRESNYCSDYNNKYYGSGIALNNDYMFLLKKKL